MDMILYIVQLDTMETLFSGSFSRCLDFLERTQVFLIEKHGICMLGEKAYWHISHLETTPEK